MATRVTVNDVAFTGNPCRVVEGTFNGRWLKAGERVWAALFFLQAWLDLHHPDLYVYVIQSAYHDGYAPSAGTHDKDRVLDVAIINRRTGRRYWLRGRRWLRRFGWAAWWRHTGSWLRPSTWHIHMVLLGGDCPIGYLVPAQISDYLNHRTGLVGHLLEPGWYPDDIDATVFDFEAWLQAQEEAQDMQLTDKIYPDREDSPTVGSTLRRMDRFITRQDERAKELLDEIDALPAGATKQEVRRIVAKALVDDSGV